MTYAGKLHKIKSIKKVNNIVKIFNISSNMKPKPGQFLEVSVPGIGECPLASCSYNTKNLKILTRLAGNVTTAMFNLKKGDSIRIRGPYGKGFPIKKLVNHNLILVAGGTGLAPITSMIEYIEKNRKQFKKIHIYLGFKDEDFILLENKIKIWQKKFNVTICLDNPKKEKNCKKGFIHTILVKDNIQVKETIALMCGPEIMMDSVTKTLIKKGLNTHQIYWSMERRMECAFGNCNRCLVQDLYVCKDGPVFRYDIIKPRLDNENSSN